MKERIKYIDNMKGFILLVVAMMHTHIDFLQPIVLCFMTTFFFISGFLSNDIEKIQVQKTLTKKFKSLMYPYLILSTITVFLVPRCYCLEDAMPFCDFWQNLTINWHFIVHEFDSIFTKGAGSWAVSPLWFVWALFFIGIIMCFLHVVLKRFNYSSILVFIFSLLCLYIGWTAHVYKVGIFWNIGTVFTASFFYLLGYLYKRHLHQWVSSCASWKLVLAALGLFPVYFIGININGACDLYVNNMGHSLPGMLLSQLTGISIMMLLFQIMSRQSDFCYIGTSLRFLAQNGICFLASHAFVLKFFLFFIGKEGFPFWYFKYPLFLIEILFFLALCPLINNYCPWLVGKKKQYI